MTRTTMWRSAASALLLLGAGCGLLDVSDPTAIEESELSDATGADLLRQDALRRLYIGVGQGTLTSGLLTDEFLSDPESFYLPGEFADEVLDRRESVQYEQRLNQGIPAGGGIYGSWQEVRRAATLAVSKLRTHTAPATQAHVGEMFAVRAFATLRLAEDFCPGFPLHEIVDLKPVYGPPLSTDEAFQHALADLDSAVAYAADSARILHLALVGRARALAGLGRFAEAATTAALVPTPYISQALYSTSHFTLNNPITMFSFTGGPVIRSVSNQEGGIGLDFVAAGDPRVQTTFVGTATDGTTSMYAPAKYPTRSAPIVLASGVEARLIEAEAALNAGDPSWLTILNDLRANQISPPLPALADPGTSAAQVDLLFRERAFWLFGTGHRLADLRRLVRHYGRGSETVFPTGVYRRGGVYGTGTSIPFPAALETPFNPAVTGCTSR